MNYFKNHKLLREFENTIFPSVDFSTISSSLQEAESIVRNLRPGLRYQFRVRPEINHTMSHWDLGIVSEIISMPPAPPNAPFNIQLQKIMENIRNPLEESTVDKISRSCLTHVDAKIDWTSGIVNGSAVLESEVQLAAVKDYVPAEVTKAENAATLLHEGEADLQWMSCSVEYSSTNSCHVKNLQPGCSYVFRARSRNKCGWSGFSLASPIITTLSQGPPVAPRVVSVSTFFIVLNNILDTANSTQYTALETELQGAIVQRSLNDGNVLKDQSTIVWQTYNTKLSEAENNDGKAESGLLVEALKPSTAYVFRFRIRTILGWSVWGDISDYISTQSQ